jgi:formylglycine-generating enzyme required for sulfatase activity
MSDLAVVADAQYAPLDGLAPGSDKACDFQRHAVDFFGLPLEIKNREVGIVFRLVPRGVFMMGSPKAEQDECVKAGAWPEWVQLETQHRVTLTREFYCGKYEVTQGQWQMVMGYNPSHFKNVDVDAPVENVSWKDCQAFAKKLCWMADVPEGTYRLLTEAEWEYACRAGTTTPFCYGSDLDSSMANFDGNYPYGGARQGQRRQATVAVGSFRANAWGLYDMHGNVWEWCQDPHGSYPSGDATDPLGLSGGGRVNRGGSWCYDGARCRSAFRNWNSPGSTRNYVGLRLARTLRPRTDGRLWL